MLLLFLVILNNCVQQTSWSLEPPKSLQQTAANRERLQTGEVKITYERLKDNVEYESFRRLFSYETLRFSTDETIAIHHGDEEGVVLRDIAGNPAPDGRMLFYGMRRGHEIWTHREDGNVAQLAPMPSHLAAPDPRTFGVSYGHSYTTLQRTLWHDFVRQPSARKYRETIENGLHVVTAQSDVGMIRWWIDPKKDWSPVRVVLYRDGEVFSQSRTVLKQFDGVWFPEVVQYYVKGHRDGKEPQITIKVLSAEFNRPDHPTKLTPADIGVIPLDVAVEKLDESGQVADYGFYDPETNGFINPEQLRQRRLERAAAYAADPANNPPPAPRWSRALFESAWEACTRNFINFHKLDDEQTQKAWSICDHCQQQARAYLAKHEQHFEEVEGRLEKLRHTKDAPGIPQLERELAHLMQPVEKIFEKRLMPGLEKLPTRAQNAAAEKNRKQ